MFKFNVFTGTLDIVNRTSTGGSGVTRVGTTNDRHITIWAGNSSDTIEDSKASIQEGGAIDAQGFVGRKEIDDAVVIPDKHYMIATGITIMVTGSITISTDSELVLI